MVNDIIKAVGAMAEMMRLFRDELLKNDFTRKVAIQMTHAYMLETISQNNNTEEN